MVGSLFGLGCSNIGDGYQSFGEELFDPDFAYIQQPRRLAAGDFSDLQMELDGDGNRFVVAINDETDELTIVPLDGGETCVAGSVDDYAASIGEELGETTLLPFVTPDNELRFTDLRCNLSDAAIPDAPLTRRLLEDAGPEGGPGILVFTGDDRVVFANPWRLGLKLGGKT